MRTIDNDTLLGEICNQLSQGRKVKLRAKGNSMRPFIHGEEDILFIAPISKPRKGDVILARIDGERYVVHRITRIMDDHITLMGDNNLYATEECSVSDVFGTVECIIRKEKEISLNSPYASFKASVWRLLLPFRRLKYKILHKFCAPFTPTSTA